MIPLNLPRRSNIVGLWKLDEVSGNRLDETEGNHTATDVNTVLYDTGKIGNAALFVAAQEECFTIVDHADLKPTGNFSISASIKTSTTGTAKVIFQNFSLITSKVAGIMFRINTDNVLELWSGKNIGNAKGTEYDYAVGTTNVCDNVLHDVVGTWDGTNLKVYVDDEAAEGTQAWADAPVYNTTYIRIGCQNNSGTNINFMNGIIDELIVWNGAALTQAEVLQVKNITAYNYSAGLGIGNPYIF